MWTKLNKVKTSEESNKLNPSKFGFYVFGGASEKKEPLNDLYFIRPHYMKNSEILDSKRFDFVDHVE